MSTITPGISAQSPEIFSSLFEGQKDRNFWVGRIAALGSVEGQKVYDASLVLRANVYSKLGYIAQEKIDIQGRELDKDDEHSIHFAVIEKPKQSAADTNGHANVVGTSRLIIKDKIDLQLPIEHYFPEAFKNGPAEEGSVEVSRLIARHDSDRTQHKIALALIRAMTHYSIDKKIQADYCMVEAPLLRLLNSSGIPTETLGEMKDVIEYGGSLIPVKIEAPKIIDNVSRDVGMTALKKFFLDGTENLGEGFYSDSFVSR